MTNKRMDELTGMFRGIDGGEIIKPLLDDVVFLEQRLTDLKKLPFLRVSDLDPSLQKATPASKQYKELLQQYNNCIKILCGLLKHNNVEDISPLREFLDKL